LPEYKYRLSSCRSRKPMLETINEEPVRSRWIVAK
jgi:predicted nucleic acid-binding Zn ribbon protein